MPTLNELLDQDMSYQEILDELTEQTDDFTLPEGEVAFNSQFEAEVAVSILKNHYKDVDNSGLDIINEAAESAFLIKFSDPIIDDLDFPKEEDVEENLNESSNFKLRESNNEHVVENKLSDKELKNKLLNVTGFDNYNDRIATTLKSKREFDSKVEDSYYLSVSSLSTTINKAKNKLELAINKIISYMGKLGYRLEYSGDYKIWDISQNTKKFTYDYQRQNVRASKQLVFSKNNMERKDIKNITPRNIDDTGYGWKSDNSDIEFASDEELYDYFDESLLYEDTFELEELKRKAKEL